MSHGSIEKVENPEIRNSYRTLDYGQGFYTTTSYEQAEAWVKRRIDENKVAKGDSFMNLNINQENVYLLLPSKISWVAVMLAEDKGVSVVEAIKLLYSSGLYKKLETESTKVWHLGPVALYQDFLSEEESLVSNNGTY